MIANFFQVLADAVPSAGRFCGGVVDTEHLAGFVQLHAEHNIVRFARDGLTFGFDVGGIQIDDGIMGL